MFKSILIGLAIIAAIFIAMISWYTFLFIGIPVGTIYLVHAIRTADVSS